MDNPGFAGDGNKVAGDGDKVVNVVPDLAKEKPGIRDGELESDVPEAYRYSAEKKALEALDSAVTVDVPRLPANKPYAGMGKEDLLRFSQTPFWNRFRMACTLIFWLVWLALLGAVVGLTITFPQCSPPPEKHWYETSVFYQIYVRSFYDSDGDGIGDINGIRSKLDYLESVDVGAVVLSSIYESHSDGTQEGKPFVQVDYGYEVTNHNAIDSTYGTLDEFLALLKEAHDLGIKVIMEFIPNYTGSKHNWFNSSSFNSSQTNPYWNYYTWADCQTGPPNNWLSVYSQPAWSSGRGPDDCYLHQFLPTQPELNLRSASVQQELEMILRYWLDLGVDGFRVVKSKYLFEDADLRSEASSLGCTDRYECYNHSYTTSQEEIYPLIENWRMILEEYTAMDHIPRLLMTDAMDSVDNTMKYYGKYGPDGAQLPMNYALTEMNTTCNARCVYNLIDTWLYPVPQHGTANWMSGTQDMMRLGDIIPQEAWDDWGYQNAVTMLKLTLPGPALMYYGEEIGMTSVNSTATDPMDPAGQFGLEYSRDPYRSPMQWSNGTYGGFINESLGNDTMMLDPWLPLGDNLFNISVEAQNGTVNSPFEFYTELALLRNTSETFHVGAMHYTLLTDNILSYYREYEGKNRYLIAINFGSMEETANIFDSHYDVPKEAEVVMTTRGEMSESVGDTANLKSLTLGPGDGYLLTWEYVRPDGKPSS